MPTQGSPVLDSIVCHLFDSGSYVALHGSRLSSSTNLASAQISVYLQVVDREDPYGVGECYPCPDTGDSPDRLRCVWEPTVGRICTERPPPSVIFTSKEEG